MNIRKGIPLLNLQTEGKLKPQVNSIVSYAFRDSPEDCKISKEYAVNDSYDKLVTYSQNIPITECRTKGTKTVISSVENNLILTLPKYSSLTT